MSRLVRHFPKEYFSDKTVECIKKHVENQLSVDFDKKYTIDDSSVRRILHRIIDQRLEDRDRMFQRVVMEIVSEIKQFELERIKHLKWEKSFPYQGIYDYNTQLGPDLHSIKLSKNPATVRFWYTYGV